MRSWITLGVLLAAVLALGAWIYLKPSARDAATYPISTLKAAQVKRVKLERPDSTQPVVLEKKDAAWRLTAPFAARADDFQVGRMLSILDARAAVRYPATELARYGLDRPVARLAVDDEGFSFGGLNKMTREQYVQKGDAVYVLPLAPGASLPRDAEALVSRALLSADEVPLRFALPGFSVTLADGAWRVEPARNDASADERVAWVDAWRHASAIRVTRHAGGAPSASISVMLKDGATLKLGVVDREPELVLLRDDEGLQYHFPAAVAKRLLSPPGEPRKSVTK